ncbi:acyl-ACP--UDP-N-acetylglucosamine O-acyltransferase [Paludibaculum fermentans]|uniref:acyl-ACP--UDP-N-acetylglucosamine O-acyltransferase n=1 Tax=Paludibaculum fermentans TaxID=1473598 RepID=UPI003EBDC4DF
MAIHPTAIIDPAARIHPDADIGPFCVIGAEVEIGARTRLMANLYIEGPTWIGEDNIFFPYGSVGVASQDLKYHGERTETRIGARNRIREFVTIHRGTEGGGSLTAIGDDNLLMAYSHIAHDAQIGSHIILGNAVTLAGHVTIGDWAIVEAFSGVHQFCRIGRHSFTGGYSVVTQDVLPYSQTVTPRQSKVYGENKIGLQRRGFTADSIAGLHKAFRLLMSDKLNTSQALEQIQAEVSPCAEVDELVEFIRTAKRGFIK